MVIRPLSAVAVLLGIVPVAIWPGAATVWWWLLTVAVVIGADLLLTPATSTVRVERELLGDSAVRHGDGKVMLSVRLGESTQTSLLVSNPTRRRVRGVLRDAWVPSAGATSNRHRLYLPGGERRRVHTPLRPTRRGDRETDRVTVRLHGPLGLAARQRSREVPGSVRALPPFHSRKHLPSRLARLRQLDGRSAVRTRGQGTEFDSLRDYVDGDDVRSIDWRATARRQTVVVRTWQPERDRRVIIVLDTSRTSAARVGDQPRLDAAMDASLLLAALASRAGDRLDLIAGDRRIRGRVRPDPASPTLLSSIVTMMAPLDPVLVEADWALLAGAVNASSRHRALVVLLTALEPAALEEGLLPVLGSLTAHHQVVVASVADPELPRMARDLASLSAVYGAAAAERTLSLHRRTAAAMERLGVQVLDEDPDRLPAVLADHYLALKARGLL
ncbi:MAG TPA: DUF58 domain-containing protein [Ornithinimicrobium sp.]|uniref:DUF58 domain-containing protein n=1 Tax=Ornithinimicrobium sp. TaxID=1977084 RepID=UPI002B498C4F|nr:DUF58 domain-containing protein [Ornithinimicrobium sp.]HKJ12645.1 DUF58 domain-containing protein [Ornithinimicrobium sp.]